MEKFKIITSNVRWVWKKVDGVPCIQQPVLVVGNNELVFIRHSQIRRGNILKDHERVVSGDWMSQYNGDCEIGIYEVEIDPENWKVYTYRNNFPNFIFDKPDTLESLYEVSQQQAKSDSYFSMNGKQQLDGAGYNNHYLWRGFRSQQEATSNG